MGKQWKRQKKNDGRGTSLNLKKPKGNKGVLQKGKNAFIDLVEQPADVAGVLLRNTERHAVYMKRFTRIARQYNKFMAGEFIVDRLPGWKKEMMMPPGFHESQENVWELNDESWLLQMECTKTESNSKKRKKKANCGGFYLVQMGEKRSDDVNKKDDKEMIFAFLPSKLHEDDAQAKEWDCHKRMFEVFMRVHTKLCRGIGAKGFFEVYVCHGARVDRSCELGEYAFKPKTKPCDKKICNDGVVSFIKEIGKKITVAIPPAELDAFRSAFRLTGADTDLFQGEEGKTFWGSLVVSINGITKVHDDDDISHGAIGCIDLQNPTSREIITHLLFPDYQIAIPLRSGDLVVFDPRVRHCTTNPRNPKAVVFSAFNNSKTMSKYISEIMECF
jgi:hypothetical protein